MHCLVSRAMAVVAALLLIVALVKPWMEVPVDIVERPGDEVRCITSRPRSAIPFRITCFGFALIMGVGHAWHRRTSDRKAMLAASFFSTLLFFPYVVMAWEPPLSAKANWLQMQHENLVWLGGDLCTNLEFAHKSWKDMVYLVDTPRQINVIRMPSSGLGVFQFGRLMTWFEMLGYSNRFCEFVRMGWITALFGTSFLIMSECLPGGRLCRRRAIRAAVAGTITFAVGIVAATTPVVLASLELDRSRSAVARGLYDDADRFLHRAIALLPAFREDTFYIAQLGLLDFRRGRNTLEARLFTANLQERQGRYAEAILVYEQLIKESRSGSAVRREAVRAVLRAGIHALNGQRHALACTWLEQVIEEEPCNVKANYALQLAYLRTGRRRDVERMVRRIVAIYQTFQMPTKSIVLSSSYENAMFSALREHDLAAAYEYALKAKKS
jgi:tetratricopeptide (TPR) repeat protein